MQKITRILCTVALVMISSMVRSQSLSFPHGDFYVQGLTTDQRLEAHLEVDNSNNNDLAVMINCDRSELVNGHQSYYCWFLCYDTSVCNSPDPLTIAGRTTDLLSFHSYIYPNAIAGQSSMSYTFYDQNNPSDSARATIVFDVLTAGVNEISKGTLSTASPNPANAFTNINYTVPSLKEGKIVICNMLGSIVKEVRLNYNQSAMIVSTSELSPGIYSYSLVNNGKTISTKKLVIAHN